MAVALEVGWGSGELGGLAHMSKKRAWGDDHQKLLEMMMGKSFEEAGSGEDSRHTLDLLGSGTSSVTQEAASEQSEFLELDQDVPLPSGWEKRLDLKSGTVYFINSNTGKTTYTDPRQAQTSASSCHMSLELLQSGLGKPNHKAAEITTTSWEPSSASNKLNVNNNNNNVNNVNNGSSNRNNSLDLKLNLSTREDVAQLQGEDSAAPTSCLWLLPAASSPNRTVVSSDEAAPSNGGSIGTNSPAKVTLTGCKRCLMYVMISQADPRCPKCGSSVVLDFPLSKKRRLELEL